MTRPLPCDTKSNATSAGSFPSSVAICAMDFPLNRSFCGLRAFTSTMPPHPPAASMMFHQPATPLRCSALTRARVGRVPIVPVSLGGSPHAADGLSSAGRGLSRRLAEPRHTCLGLAEVRAEVDADALLLELSEIRRHLAGRHRSATLAADRRGHAHHQLVFRARIPAKHTA